MAVLDSQAAATDLVRIRHQQNNSRVFAQQYADILFVLQKLCTQYPQGAQHTPISKAPTGSAAVRPNAYAASSGNFEVQFRVLYQHAVGNRAVLEVLRYDWI